MKKTIKYLSIFFLIIFVKNSYALTLEDSINLALKSNQEIKLYEHRLYDSKFENYHALAEFLPKIFINIQNGKRINKNDNFNEKINFTSREISFDQAIFNGFSSILNLKKSDKIYLIELANLKERKQNLASEVAKIYSNIFWQRKNLENYRKIYDLTKKILEIKSQKLSVKIIDKEEFIRDQIELENLNQKIANEELDLIKNYNDFIALVGVGFEKINEFKIIEIPIKKSEILLKINQNFLLQSKYLKYQLSLDNVALKTSEFLPKVSIIANISKQKNNIYSANNQINNRSVMLNFSIPIFQNGHEYIDYNASKNQSKIALDEYEIYKNYLTLEISKICDELESTLQNLKISQNMLGFLEEKKQILQSKYNAKIIDLIELYNAEISLEFQKIANNKLQNILNYFHYKILGLIGEINV